MFVIDTVLLPAPPRSPPPPGSDGGYGGYGGYGYYGYYGYYGPYGTPLPVYSPPYGGNGAGFPPSPPDEPSSADRRSLTTVELLVVQLMLYGCYQLVCMVLLGLSG